MIINGLKLPKLFIEDLEKGLFKRMAGSWQLLNEVDSYGNHLETSLGLVFDLETIVQETNNLSDDFKPDGFYGGKSDWENEPGFIPDIIDFSRIVCFGISGDGSPFCYDFRDIINDPSVIWWDDVYWRRISPNYHAFRMLFNL